jgi:hypothetical protein
VNSGHLSKRAQQARFICALATPLSADFLPRSGLVQYLFRDPQRFVALQKTICTNLASLPLLKFIPLFFPDDRYPLEEIR